MNGVNIKMNSSFNCIWNKSLAAMYLRHLFSYNVSKGNHKKGIIYFNKRLFYDPCHDVSFVKIK
jgi:hypothetical protein